MTKPVILVTGGAGFIGSHLVDVALSDGYAVRVVDSLVGGHERNLAHHGTNQDLSFEKADIRDLDADAAVFKGVKSIVHYAGDRRHRAQHRTTRGLHVHERSGHREGVGRRAIRWRGKVRLCSVFILLWLGRDADPRRSSDRSAISLCPVEIYGGTSRVSLASGIRPAGQCDPHFQRLWDTGAHHGAYGAVFGVFFRQKLAGQPFTVVGDGTQTRDFLYASDVARAFLAASETPISGQIWNLGAGSPQSVNRLVELIGGDVTYVPKRPGEPDSTHADITKITRDLNWAPTIPFEDGVAKMMAEIDVWKDAPLWTPDKIADATKTWFKYLGDK